MVLASYRVAGPQNDRQNLRRGAIAIRMASIKIQTINSGALGREFSEVVYIGHSYGAVLGQVFSAKYPTDVKRIILQG